MCAVSHTGADRRRVRAARRGRGCGVGSEAFERLSTELREEQVVKEILDVIKDFPRAVSERTGEQQAMKGRAQ